MRSTVILPIRIKRDLLGELNQAIPNSKTPSRNAWIIRAIKQGLRKR